MNLVFIHPSEKVKRDNLGNLYTDGSYSEDIWNMYLKLFSHITLLMREDTQVYDYKVAQKKFNLIPQKRIEFKPLHDHSSSFKSYILNSLYNENDCIIRKEIEGADAIIVRIPGNYKAIRYAVSQNKPCLVEVVGCPFDSLWNHSYKGKILAPISYYKMKKSVLNAPNAIYVTSEFLQRRYPTKGRFIGCSDVRLQNIDEHNLCQQIDKIQQPKKLCIGTASGIGVKYKGQQYVIQAIHELKKEGINCFEYEIAGAGNPSYLNGVIKKYKLEKEIKIIGSIPHNKMFDWYKHLDIYVQPSRTEGLPRALVEAMSCAVPSMGSKVGGIPELLKEETTFKRGSIKEIKNILRKMLDTNFRIKQAENCFLTSKQYQVDVLEEKRLNFMKSVFKYNQNF